MDLKSMSRKELEKLLSDVKKALQSAQARDRRDARKAAAKAAAEFGFSLDELGETEKPKKARKTAKKKAKPGKAQFANPDDPSQTWTGKGRQPNWYRLAIENGTSADTLRV